MSSGQVIALRQREIQAALVVEDHPVAQAALANVVVDTFSPGCVDTVGSVSEGLQLLERQSYDLALVDIGLPDGSGIDIVREIRLRFGSTITLITSIFDDDTHLFEALQAGADGYLLKGHPEDELAEYLLAAVDGKPALSPRIAQSVLRFFRDMEPSDERKLLSERELEVLLLISKGCTVQEVSDLLAIANNTVRYHIKNIYSKLSIHSRAEATAAAVRMKIYTPD